jgi:hypothetical protein
VLTHDTTEITGAAEYLDILKDLKKKMNELRKVNNKDPYFHTPAAKKIAENTKNIKGVRAAAKSKPANTLSKDVELLLQGSTTVKKGRLPKPRCELAAEGLRLAAKRQKEKDCLDKIDNLWHSAIKERRAIRALRRAHLQTDKPPARSLQPPASK